MATVYLNDGAVSVANANWSSGTGFTANAELVIRSGGQAIVSDMDQSGAGSIRYLKIAENFSGSIGTAASPLYTIATDGSIAEWSTASGNEGRVIHGGGGTLYLRAAGAGIDNLHQTGGGRTVLVNGTATFGRLLNGTLDVEALGTVGTLWAFNGQASIGASATASTLLNLVGGSVLLARPYTTINVYGGELIVNATTSSSAAMTVNQYGGTVTLIALNTSNTFNYNRYAGLFDPSRLTRDVTVATMYTGRAARFTKLATGGPDLTITNQYLLDSDAQRI